jgi:hypothetical protein
MAIAVTDSMKYHLDTSRGRNTLQASLSSLTSAGVNITTHQSEAALASNGPDGAGALAMSLADSTFTDTRKVAVSLTSPLPLLFAAIFKNYHSHDARPDQPPLPANLPRPESCERGRRDPTPKPIPHTQAALDRTDLATDLLADDTWATIGLPSLEGKTTSSSPPQHIKKLDHLRFHYAEGARLEPSRRLSQTRLPGRPLNLPHPSYR